VLCFSLLSTSRPRPGGGEACVRIRCWGPRRAGARFCFRGSRAMSLWPAARLPNNSTTQRAQGPARRKALGELEANPQLNCLWRPPLGARAPKTEFLRLNQRKHTTHALQRTTGTTPTSVTHWEFTGGVWEVACSSGALGEAGMGRQPGRALRWSVFGEGTCGGGGCAGLFVGAHGAD
jgi:hypothetical protein